MQFWGKIVSPQLLRACVGSPSQIASATLAQLADGVSAGVRVIDLMNASGLFARCVLDRCMDMSDLRWQGMPLCWQSANGIQPASRYDSHGDGFLKSFFGGLVTTCGLTNFGPAGEDRWGAFGLHGPIDHCSAENVQLSGGETAHEVFEITGTIRQTRVFGENFRLERTWRFPKSGTWLELHDRVTNDGGKSWPHMLLYHCNAGFPLLNEDTEVRIAHSKMWPRDAAAETGLKVWNRGGPPDPNFEEQVFIHEMRQPQESTPSASITNRSLGGGVALSISWDPAQLPYAITWRMLGHGTYVYAVEPANCPTIEGRIEAEKRGTLPMLEPGETRAYDLRFQIK